MKKKTIFIASKFGLANIGGLERVNYYIYEILSSKYDVKIIQKREKCFKHGDWLFQSIYISLKLFFCRRKFVIGNSWHSFLYPCDITLHHGTMYGNVMHLKGDKKYAFRIARMEKIGGHTAKLNIAVGENVKKELIDFYNISEKKILVLNNFIDDSKYTPKKLQSDNDTVRIIYVGRLDKGKGLEHLIALSNAIKDRNDIEFKIATVTKDYETINKFNNTNTTVLVGIPHNDMPEFYSNGDVLFFPTQYEGFSLATLEALCCGIPVIGTKWAISKELQGYDFCKLIEDFSNYDNIINTAKELKNQYSEKREILHNTIAERFGKKAYETKLLTLVEGLL